MCSSDLAGCFLKTVAGIGGLDFLFEDGAELGEGIYDIIRTVTAKLAVFAFIKHLHLRGPVGIGKNLRCGRLGLEGHFLFRRVLKTAAGADQSFTGLGEPVVDRFTIEEGIRTTITAMDFYCTHGIKYV